MTGLKTLLVVAAFTMISGSCFLSTVVAEEKNADKLITEKEKISYALGFNIGQNLKRDFDLDLDVFFRGVKESQDGKKSLSDKQMQEVMTVFQNSLREKQQKKMKMAAEVNKAKGEMFLAENKKKEGVITLKSGLQYRVITQGDGDTPVASDSVKCHYRGTHIDGNEFDSSYKRGTPATFKVNGVIKGWTEALQLMKVGSKWELYIPYDLAYGERGAGQRIPPGSALIFEIELLGIE